MTEPADAHTCQHGHRGWKGNECGLCETREECSPPLCTLAREEHEGEGHEFGNPCSNGCIHPDGHEDIDYTEPHQWFQYTGLPKGDPYCSGCQLPYENARHRGEFTITVTVHGNDLALVREEVDNLVRYFHEGDTSSDLWLAIGEVEHHSE